MTFSIYSLILSTFINFDGFVEVFSTEIEYLNTLFEKII
jgi:hypothetical protein